MNMAITDKLTIDLSSAERSDLQLRLSLGDDFFSQFDQDEVFGGSFEVNLLVRHGAADTFTFAYQGEGTIQVACDRCLEATDVYVSFAEEIKVAYGERETVNSDLCIIPYSQLKYNIAWDLYELIMLNCPLQRVHPDGHCNNDMLSRFSIEQDSEDEDNDEF